VVGSWVCAPEAALGAPQSPSRRGADQHRGARQRALHRYVYFFQAAGVILLVAMIGAIVLTLRHARTSSARTSPSRSRARGDRGRVRKVRPRGPASEESGMIGLSHYLTVAAILFTIGIFGIFLNRKNVIVILMSVELILLAVNINLVAFSASSAT
jgi:hypothetical protein